MRTRNWLAAAALAGVGAAVAMPTLAQADGPFGPVALADEAMAEFVDVCARITGSLAAVEARAEELGWAPEASGGTDEFYTEVVGDKEFAGVGAGELTAFVESYPSRQIAVFKIDIQDPGRLLGIVEASALSWLSGSVNDFGDAVFGSWEEPGGEPTYFVQSYQLPDFFSVQITALGQAGKSKN